MASSLPRPATRTASRCTPRTARGTHAFEIAGYSLHRGLGVGNFIRSAAFDVGGYSWCIRFYPDGYADGEEDSRDDDDDNVAAFLELLTEDAEVRAHYDFRLLDRSTGTSSSVFSTAAPQVFDTLGVREEKYFAWGTDELMERSELEEASAYLVDDGLVIECDVTVIMEPQVEENTMAASDVEVPPSDLSSSFGKLLEMEERADVIFKVEDEVFHAHKVVLAVRSPIFVAEPDEGKKKECIVIEDMQPAVFKALLHFIYTDTLPAMEGLDGDEKKEIVKQLLVAADRYAMNRLKLICEGILCKSLDACCDHGCHACSS
ncbi:hypothetical protein PAHAL_6G077800 [Panicum hallii]|jgi:speckle-type POZ protein|uniref:BTB domain-containing protein n=1 Tax=Panicum hallii TaxID=206008 RepID=A0A2T8IFK8_9POAL|nr:hypothetical protein PAHAL_6G077800 [Panicum hallii]